MRNKLYFFCIPPLLPNRQHKELPWSNSFLQPFSLLAAFCDEQLAISWSTSHPNSKNWTPPFLQWVWLRHARVLVGLPGSKRKGGWEPSKLSTLWSYYSSYIECIYKPHFKSDCRVAVEVRQSICIYWLFLLHYCCYHWSHYRLIHHLCSLSFKEFSYRCIGVYSLHVGVVSQHLVCQIFSNSVLDVGTWALFWYCVLVPLFLLLHLASQLLHPFYINFYVLCDLSLATDLP